MKKLSICLTQGAIAACLLGTCSVSPSLAAFILVNPGNPNQTRNNPFEYSFVANWTFADGVEDNVVINGPWGVELISFAKDPLDNSKDLTLSGIHMMPPHPGEGPNPFTLFLGSFISPPAGVSRKGVAEQFTHGNHFDIIRVLVQVPQNAGAAIPATITSTGQHIIPSRLNPRPPLTTGSILGITGDAKFIINGGAQDGDPIRGGTLNGQPGPADGIFTNLSPRDRVMSGRLPDDATGYTVVAAVGGAVLPIDPVTTTSLAFLGEVDSVPGQLDLGAAMQLFVGSEEFFVPLLSDQTGRDLFVGIDLTQWLSFPTPFDVLDEFSFLGGISEQLPGILVGTSPVTYNSTLGMFVTDDPATGEFLVTGKIDGRTATVPVPEPEVTVGLLALGTLGAGSLLKGNKNQKSAEK